MPNESSPEFPPFVDYVGVRKPGAPIPDFVDAGFFNDLPLLATVSRQQLETLMALGVYMKMVLDMPKVTRPGEDPDVRWAAQMIKHAAMIYAHKQKMPLARVTRIIADILNWLNANDWELVAFHSVKDAGGDTFFTNLKMKCLVWQDGDQN
jgi:hypothetical protein